MFSSTSGWTVSRLSAHSEVKQSDIAGAGDGVFATVGLKKGDFIVMYTPLNSSRRVFGDGTAAAYSAALDASRAYASKLQKANGHSVIRWTVPAEYCVIVEDAHQHQGDARTVPDHGFMCNSCGESTFLTNAEFYTVDTRVAVRALKDIGKGDEIVVDYGVHEYGGIGTDDTKVSDATRQQIQEHFRGSSAKSATVAKPGDVKPLGQHLIKKKQVRTAAGTDGPTAALFCMPPHIHAQPDQSMHTITDRAII